MYKTHRSFLEPTKNIKVWRYIDFTKLVSILDKKALYFSRADRLGDKFEGSYTLKNAEMRKKKNIKGMFFLNKVTKVIPKCIYVNSWHINNNESAAMWELYSKGKGVAIQSSFNKMKASLRSTSTDIHIGKIRYIDHHKDEPIDPNNLFNPFLYKRKSFKHEQEIRMVFGELESLVDFYKKNPGGKNLDLKTPRGKYVSITPKILIEKIYISPKADKWYKNLTESVVKKYGFKEIQVVHSSMDKDPIF